ncbi:MAG: replication protein A, partial [Methanothrix sp.]|nr:replication protein A [Methanothrix sp.]
GSDKVKIADIKEAGKWVDIEAKVLDLWEPAAETISQTGLLGDATGSIKFVKWAKSDLPNLELGKSYLLKKMVTDEFQGRFSVKLNRTSQIEALGAEVEAKPASRAPLQVTVAEINEPGKWVDLRVKVAQLWETNSEAISQSGLVGDETGSIKFVKWVKADLPDLEEGKSYLLKNLVTDEFQGRFSVKMNRTSQIQPLDVDVEIGSIAAEFSGALVDVQKGSGLIKRCPVCKRSLAKGVCSEHGKVDGTYDLRIKAVLDDGRRVQDLLVNRETTERLLNLTLEEAKQMAMEALDHEVVRSLIESKLMGRYYSATGPRIDRYLLVESIMQLPPASAAQVDELIGAAEVV